MMTRFVPVPAPRSTLTRSGGGGDVVIPARRNPLVLVLFPLWLCGWAYGFASVFDVPAAADVDARFFTSVWLLGWVVGGVAALAIWLWNLVGAEYLRFGRDEVLLRRRIVGLGIGRRYDPARVRNLRAVDFDARAPGRFFSSGVPFGASTRPLAFDYGAHTIRFGAGVDYAEAADLVGRILSVAPWLNPSS